MKGLFFLGSIYSSFVLLNEYAHEILSICIIIELVNQLTDQLVYTYSALRL